MKKMYKKPLTTDVEIQTASMVCTSPGINNTPIDGIDSEHREFGNAPKRYKVF